MSEKERPRTPGAAKGRATVTVPLRQCVQWERPSRWRRFVAWWRARVRPPTWWELRRALWQRVFWWCGNFRRHPRRYRLCLRAVVVLACWRVPVWGTLAGALDAERWYARHFAAEVFRQLGRHAVPFLLRALRQPPEDVFEDEEGFGIYTPRYALAALARLLGQIGDRRAVPVLVEVVQHEWRDHVRCAAVEALARLGDSSVVPVLCRVAADPDVAVRRAALEGLTRFHDPRAIPLWAAALADSDSEVLMCARQALVAVGVQAVPALLKVLEGPNLGARLEAALALGEIGAEARAAVPHLLALAQQVKGSERAMVISMLGNICDPSAVPYIV